MHYHRWRRHGDAETRYPPKSAVKYRQAHHRLGKAANHPCADCGAPARDWCYLGGDPQELVEPYQGYSVNPDYYIAKCRSCHMKSDGRIHNITWMRK